MKSVVQEVMATLTEIKVSVAKIETKQDNLVNMVIQHRHEVNEHIKKDELNLKAVSIEMANLEQKINSNHGWVKSMILPALGGFSVIVFIIKMIK